MQGKTHRAGGMLCSIVGFALLQQNNLLLPDVNEGVQWLVMYPFTMWGSVASDLDHHWDSCPEKDYPSRLVNVALHITAPIKKTLDRSLSERQKKHSVIYQISNLFCASHRSWQTHSDLTLYLMIYLLYNILSGKFTSLGAVDISILSLIVMGVCLGVIAHLILDVLTPEGIWIIETSVLNKLLRLINPRLHINLPEKVHLVPKSRFFATGGAWEEFVQKVLQVTTLVSLAWFFLNLFIPNWMDYIPYQITLGG